MNLLQFPIWSKKIQKFHEVPEEAQGERMLALRLPLQSAAT